jgi:hypothetical protein
MKKIKSGILYKTFFFITVITALMFLNGGCSSPEKKEEISKKQQEKLEEERISIIEQYYKALGSGNYEEAYSLLSDKSFKVTLPDNTSYEFKAKPPLEDFIEGAKNIGRIEIIKIKPVPNKNDKVQYLYAYDVKVDITYFKIIVHRSGENSFLIFVSSPPDKPLKIHNLISNP